MAAARYISDSGFVMLTFLGFFIPFGKLAE
jgi:hypothetical protein